MQQFFCPFEVKLDNGEDDGTIRGYGSAFGNIDSYGDIVAKGAFKKTIADVMTGAKSWPAMLLQHGDATSDGKTPIDIWTNMEEDDRGLRLEGKLAIKTERGRDAYALLKMKPRPALDGLSIGYRCTDYELQKAGSPARRTIKVVDLVEVSLVTFPANTRARVTSVKAGFGSKARLAMALMLYTGQRRSDAVLFGPEHLRNGWLVFTQQKNKRRKTIRLEIPVRAELQEILSSSATGNATFLVTEFGRPFSANGFGNWLRKRCDEAGLSHWRAHGLRKAAAARLAELGAPENEIMAITGHRTSKEITRYTRAARQRVLAENAFARHDVSHLESKKEGGTQIDDLDDEIIEDLKGMMPRGRNRTLFSPEKPKSSNAESA